MRGKNTLVFIITLLCGIVCGGFLGEIAKNISWLSWLSYGQTFGFANNAPAVFDLGVIKIYFGIGITINIAMIIGIIISCIVFRLIKFK